jgi:hypothetical protein
MKLNELKPPAPPEPPPAWRLQLKQFWREATEIQRIDMRVTLEMGDGAGAQRILESWQQELAERRRKKKASRKKPPRRRFQYGAFGGWFYPGFHNNSSNDTADTGGDAGGESIQEQQSADITDILPRFVDFCCDQLDIQQKPRIRLRRDPVWSERNGTFGRFDHDKGVIDLAVAQRHPLDVLRTLAHELVHHRQDQEHSLPADAGETGSVWEDEANALAGRIMRDFVDGNRELFGQDLEEGWRERAAALGAAACVAGTPGCATTGTTAADALRTMQTIGRTAQNLPTKAGAEEELRQELRRIINRGRGTDADPRVFRESSGYIPTAAEKDDPRFSMALTTDIRPGETGRQANKLGLKTDSQGRPALLMQRLENKLKVIKEGLDVPTYDPRVLARRHGVSVKDIQQQLRKGIKVELEHTTDPAIAREIALDHLAEFPDYYDRLAKAETNEDTELMEVEMNPGAFRRFLASPEAEGIQAGFEAELIFRDAQSDEGSSGENDYDWDTRANDIADIIDFFTTGRDNNLSSRQAQRLQDDLNEQFLDWVRESFDEGYFDLARFQEWADDVIWPEVEDQYRDHARENLDDPDVSDEDIEKEAITLFHDDVERDWDRSGEWTDRAREELYDEYAADQDESDWLESQGIRYMSDIANEWNLDWPYLTQGGGGSREWTDIGASLERATGLPVRVGTGYHSMRRRPGEYVIEPDSSLDADDGEDFGLEVVSPPLPLPEALEQLRRVIDWANGVGDAYTNSSTGLHMGVSIPYKGGDVDPIKLILFMGDKNLLETFGRESNSYTRSAMERLQSKISDMRNAGPQQISGIMNLMRRSLIELADRDLKKGVLGQKYVSVNPHDGYIEFRGPGGDYLAKNDEIDAILENTMMRLAYAMHIAGRPDLYRDEYAKKLYKVLTGFRGAVTTKSGQDTRYRTEIETETDDPFMRLFSDYSAGTLSGQELKRKWAKAVVDMENKKDTRDTIQTEPPAPEPRSKTGARRAEKARKILDRPLVWHVEDTNDGRVIMVRASDRDAARREARRIDTGFNNLHHNDPDSFLVQPATAAETQQYVQQQADAQADSQSLQARLGATSGLTSDPNALAPGESDWLVSWSEYRDRNGREELVQDSLRTVARTAADASSRLIDTLAMQGRVAFNVRSEPTDPPAWRRTTEPAAGEPIPGSTLDIQRQRQQAAQQPQAEFSGRWQIRNANTGDVLQTISGIGNVQVDANRIAREWAQRNGVAHIPLEVVPEMR